MLSEQRAKEVKKRPNLMKNIKSITTAQHKESKVGPNLLDNPHTHTHSYPTTHIKARFKVSSSLYFSLIHLCPFTVLKKLTSLLLLKIQYQFENETNKTLKPKNKFFFSSSFFSVFFSQISPDLLGSKLKNTKNRKLYTKN
jgi:hypothetical protein